MNKALSSSESRSSEEENKFQQPERINNKHPNQSGNESLPYTLNEGLTMPLIVSHSLLNKSEQNDRPTTTMIRKVYGKRLSASVQTFGGDSMKHRSSKKSQFYEESHQPTTEELNVSSNEESSISGTESEDFTQFRKDLHELRSKNIALRDKCSKLKKT